MDVCMKLLLLLLLLLTSIRQYLYYLYAMAVFESFGFPAMSRSGCELIFSCIQNKHMDANDISFRFYCMKVLWKFIMEK